MTAKVCCLSSPLAFQPFLLDSAYLGRDLPNFVQTWTALGNDFVHSVLRLTDVPRTLLSVHA